MRAATEDEIAEIGVTTMGERLAGEIRAFAAEWVPAVSGAGRAQRVRLSFVAHSIGGLVSRAALPLLLAQKELAGQTKRLDFVPHTFVSFSSPHLGYAAGASTIVSTGLWLLKQKYRAVRDICDATFLAGL